MITEIVILAVAIVATAGFILGLTAWRRRRTPDARYLDPWLVEIEDRHHVRIVCSRCGYMAGLFTAHRRANVSELIDVIGRDCSDAHEPSHLEAL